MTKRTRKPSTKRLSPLLARGSVVLLPILLFACATAVHPAGSAAKEAQVSAPVAPEAQPAAPQAPATLQAASPPPASAPAVQPVPDKAAQAEAKGDDLAAAGKSFEAVASYIDAAAAAAGSDGDEAASRLARAVAKAEGLLGSIQLVKIDDNLTGMIGKPLSSSFQAKIVSTTNGSQRALAGVPVTFSYVTAGPNGGAPAASNLQSGPDGSVFFDLPPPTLIGPGSVKLVLDLESESTHLDQIKARDAKSAAGLGEAIAGKVASFSYRVSSLSASIPTGILVLDLDRSNNVIAGDDAASGLLDSLSKAGFVMTLVPSNESLVGIDDDDLILVVRNNFSDQFSRIVFGQVSITGFGQDATGAYKVQIAGTIKAADLASGKILFSRTASKSSIGSMASSAISAAFRQLGEQIGQEMANTLP